ncbi:MAG: hypothetical protein GXC72_00895 [Chitinophagaceae bacterium]|nr:hypothetical protein [Chitinophagaceae bacterium]
MKKVIILAIMAFFTITAGTAQTAEKEPERTKLPYVQEKAAKPEKHNTDTLVVPQSAKFIKVGDKLIPVSELASAEKIPLFVPLGWIIGQYQYLDNSTGSGLTKKQIEELQGPLEPYYRYYLQAMQQQRQAAAEKPKQ